MRFAIVEAPSILGLTPSGVQELPRALLDAGLAAPLVLGGDCSILLGSMLALRRLGRYGLLFVDGHADFYQPAANVNGQVASSDLALATGRGPALRTDLEGRAPLVRDEDVVAFGRRDQHEAAKYGSDEPPRALRVIDLAAIRTAGIDAALTDALSRVIRPGLAGLWLHVDADVLDDAIMPAVDYRLPGGLSWSELEALLAAARATGRLAGLEVTIFNPRLDPTGAIAGALTDALIAGLTPTG